MTKESVIELVKLVSGVDNITSTCDSEDELFARYVATIIMYEEGHSLADIAKYFSMSRGSSYYVKNQADNMLSYNRQFKNLYLSCIAKIAESEV